MTPDKQYSLRKTNKLQQPIQMQLSVTFLNSFAAFLKYTSNFEHFEKNDNPHSIFIFEIIDCERRGYLNVKKAPVQNTL